MSSLAVRVRGEVSRHPTTPAEPGPNQGQVAAWAAAAATRAASDNSGSSRSGSSATNANTGRSGGARLSRPPCMPQCRAPSAHTPPPHPAGLPSSCGASSASGGRTVEAQSGHGVAGEQRRDGQARGAMGTGTEARKSKGSPSPPAQRGLRSVLHAHILGSTALLLQHILVAVPAGAASYRLACFFPGLDRHRERRQLGGPQTSSPAAGST